MLRDGRCIRPAPSRAQKECGIRDGFSSISVSKRAHGRSEFRILDTRRFSIKGPFWGAGEHLNYRNVGITEAIPFGGQGSAQLY